MTQNSCYVIGNSTPRRLARPLFSPSSQPASQRTLCELARLSLALQAKRTACQPARLWRDHRGLTNERCSLTQYCLERTGAVAIWLAALLVVVMVMVMVVVKVTRKITQTHLSPDRKKKEARKIGASVRIKV